MYPWLSLGPLVISTYSLCFLCAFLVGGLLTSHEIKRQHRATEAILRVALGALAGGLLGAKLSMLIFLGPATFIKDLPSLVQRTGMDRRLFWWLSGCLAR
jgi:prolipoprotein diacylglyceryltransferase